MAKSIAIRSSKLTRSAWRTIDELIDTFDNGGSFQDVVAEARELKRRRKLIAAEMHEAAMTNGGKNG